MEETKRMLRQVFGTTNELTIPISGTGSAGLEATIVNLVEPGDEVVIGVNGVFGTRLTDVAARAGATVVQAEAPWGEIIPPETIAAALGRARRSRGSSCWCTPRRRPAPGSRSTTRAASRTSTTRSSSSTASPRSAAARSTIDASGIDAAYSGTQKCLSCPPGSVAGDVRAARASSALRARTRKVQSWYLDLTMLEKYWGEERVYHHTAPISMNYALYEALRRRARRRRATPASRAIARTTRRLVGGLEALGLTMAVAPGQRLWMLNSVRIPAGVDDAAVRKALLDEDTDRDRRRARPAQGSDLAHRAHGRVEPAAQRARGCSARSSACCPRHGFACDAAAPASRPPNTSMRSTRAAS